MSRAEVASTAGRFVPITSTPEARGVPMIGPSPSMQTIPSTIVIVLGSEALISLIVCGMPLWCSTFFGQPYTPPGTTPKRFFILRVAPTQ